MSESGLWWEVGELDVEAGEGGDEEGGDVGVGGNERGVQERGGTNEGLAVHCGEGTMGMFDRFWRKKQNGENFKNKCATGEKREDKRRNKL